MLENCFNIKPEEAINIRNEEMLANNELFTGGANDIDNLRAF